MSQMILRQRAKKEMDPGGSSSSVADSSLSSSTTSASDQVPLLPQEDVILEPPTTSVPKKLGLFSILGLTIVCTQIFCEVTKQLSNYSLQYFSTGYYPLPQTILVVLIEIIKLIGTLVRAKCQLPSMSVASVKSSLRFLLPSVLYAVNNNIYFAGLTLVPPPIWLILCSFRTVVTASIYKFVLRRQLTLWQFLGAFLIVISIAVAKTPDLIQLWRGSTLTSDHVNPVPFAAIVLAAIASCNSVGAAVYTEHLFKSGATKGESFLDQQFWLYLYGAMIASIVHVVTNPIYSVNQFADDILGMSPTLKVLLVSALTFGSVGGLVVASILKLLDNIVKEYSGSVANILTAVACSFLFPDKFKFTPYVILSMACLLIGIYLYETKKAKTDEKSSKNSTTKH